MGCGASKGDSDENRPLEADIIATVHSSSSFRASKPAHRILPAYRLRYKHDPTPSPSGASHLGVSLRVLRAFIAQHVDTFEPTVDQEMEAMRKGSKLAPWPPAPKGLTTRQVVDFIIKPISRAFRLSYADLLEAGTQDVGPPHYFVSHAWSRPFKETVGMVMERLSTAADGTRVWFDFFAINQHDADGNERQQFAEAIKGAWGTLLCLDDSATPLARIWCLHELDHTLRGGFDKLLLLHPGFTRWHLADTYHAIDAKHAKASSAEDVMRLEQDMVQAHGSMHAFAGKLKLTLLLEPLSYASDLAWLTRNAAACQWQPEPVVAWLRDRQAERLLCISGDVGSGKSTVSAAMLTHRDTAWAIGAHHFVRHSDQRRTDVTLLIKSLAFQLAFSERSPNDLRYPAMHRHFLGLTPHELAGLDTTEQLFLELLARPIARCVPHDEQVVLLLDGLDEADPQDDAAGAAGRVPLPCGNAVLQLLKRQLARLPPNVRFIVTTRPQAAGGNVLDTLARTFGGYDGIKVMSPADLTLAGGAGSGPPSPTLPLGRFLPPIAGAIGGGNSGGSSSGGGMMVYRTLHAAGLLEGALGAAAPRGPVLPSDLASLQAAYQHIFEKGMSNTVISVPQRVHVTQLLQVVVAAQEPLPLSLLRSMGLADVLALVPGGGLLVFVEDSRVHVLHRTLLEWLSAVPAGSGAAAARNKHAVGVAAGHLLLGQHLAKEAEPGSRPSQYCLKYVVKHLADAGPSEGAGDAGALLCRLLGSSEFLNAVFLAGYGPKLVTDLGAAAHPLPAYAVEALRWLRLRQHNLLAELRTSKWRPSGAAGREPLLAFADYPLALGEALRAPIRTAVFRHAESTAGTAWKTMDAIGFRHWPLLQLTLSDGGGRDQLPIAYSPDGRYIASGNSEGKISIWSTASGQMLSQMLVGPPVAAASTTSSPDRLPQRRRAPPSGSSSSGDDDSDDREPDVISRKEEQEDDEDDEFNYSGSGRVDVALPRGRGFRVTITTVVIEEMTRGGAGAGGNNAYGRSERDHERERRIVDDSSEEEGEERDDDRNNYGNSRGSDESGFNNFSLYYSTGRKRRQSSRGGNGNNDNSDTEDDESRNDDGSSDEEEESVHVGRANSVSSARSGTSSVGNPNGGMFDQAVSGVVEFGTPLHSLTFSHDGLVVVAGGVDGHLHAMDTLTGDCLATWPASKGKVIGAAYMAAPRVPTPALGNTMRSGAATASVVAVGAANAAAGPPTLITAGSDGKVSLWSAPVPSARGTPAASSGSLDGSRPATGSAPMLLRSFLDPLNSPGLKLTCFTASADGSTAAAGGSDRYVRVWSVADGRCIAALRASGDNSPVLSVALTADGVTLAMGRDGGRVQLWDAWARKMKADHVVKGHTPDAAIHSLTFSKDGLILASGGSDSRVCFTRVSDGTCLSAPSCSTFYSVAVGSIAFNPRGTHIAAGGGGWLGVYEVPASTGGNKSSNDLPGSGSAAGAPGTLREFDTQLLPLSSAALAPDARHVYSTQGDGAVHVWDVDKGSCVRRLLLPGASSTQLDAAAGSDQAQNAVVMTPGRPSTESSRRFALRSIAVSADGSLVAAASSDHYVYVWDTAKGTCVHSLAGHHGPVNGVTFIPPPQQQQGGSRNRDPSVHGGHAAEHLLVSVSDDSTVRLWECARGSCVKTLAGHTAPVHAIAAALSRMDGGHARLASAGDGQLKVWDPWQSSNKACVRRFDDSVHIFHCVAFSSDGARVAAGSNHNVVTIYDVDSGEALHRLKADGRMFGHFRSVAFGPRNKRIFAGSDNDRIYVYDVDSGAAEGSIIGHQSPVMGIAFSKDGGRCVSASMDGCIRTWAVHGK